MSNRIKSKLSDINAELTRLKQSVLAGKREIAYAIKYNGITTVHPYEDTDNVYSTFSELAALIRKLKASNSMILEFQIPTTATTNYKRTIVLPLYFGSGYAPGSLNAIAKEIIAASPQTQPLMDMSMPMLDGPAFQDGGIYVPEAATDEEIANATPVEVVTFPDEEHPGEADFGGVGVDDGFILDPEMPVVDENIPYITDVFGNECIDGNYIPSMNDIEKYLSVEQQIEMLSAMEDLGITTVEDDNVEGGIATQQMDAPMMLSMAAAPVTHAETINEANYEYVVNWGDGSKPCEFHNGGTYESNKAAMWHTYENPGIYDVTITGNFRRIYSNETSASNLVENDVTILDTDGVAVVSGRNYAMYNHLISVISWGNTLLNNLNRAFCNCRKLATIPMYDTSNSFEDVTNCEYMFYYCTSLTQIPFNENTNKGLFSGCKKVTTFAGAFQQCQGMTSAIPEKLFDGCESVTTLAGCFAYSRFTGAIPNGILDGMTSLTNASEMFASCNLSGELSTDLFAGCPNITSIYRLFYGCRNVRGRITRNFIGGLSKLTDMRQAFYGCEGITGIDSDAFWNLKSNDINCRQAFYNCIGIKEIPDGLLEEMTGKNLMLEKMFDRCTGIKYISPTAIQNLKVANARGMFGGCTAMGNSFVNEDEETVEVNFPNANADWADYDHMEKWFGAFARTGFQGDKANFAKELGGNGNRAFPEREVGKIVLQDNTRVEVEDYVYNASNKPIGWVYADVYLDKSRRMPTLGNGAGNKVLKSVAVEGGVLKEGYEHKLLVAPWSDTTKTWVDAQIHAEDLDTITNTSTTSVVYNTWTYSEDGTTQTLNATRYNGEIYSMAIKRFIMDKGYADNVLKTGFTSYSVVSTLPSAADAVTTNIYFMKDSSDNNHYVGYKLSGSNIVADASLDVELINVKSSRYPALQYCSEYNANGIVAGNCHLQDATDGWDLWVMREWMQKACQKVIAGGGGFSTSNCIPYRDGTGYWASAEISSTHAWSCETNVSYVHFNYIGKWNSLYVRPSLAII